jgi:hypothetical protein
VSVERQIDAVVEAIQEALTCLPDETSRKAALARVLENRCRTCLDYDESGSFWCCYESRGG